MNRFIEKLKNTTIGQVVEPVKNLPLLDAALGFTAVLGVLELGNTLLAKLAGDEELADRCKTAAFLSLMANGLLTMMSADPYAVVDDDDDEDDEDDDEDEAEDAADEAEKAEKTEKTGDDEVAMPDIVIVDVEDSEKPEDPEAPEAEA